MYTVVPTVALANVLTGRRKKTIDKPTEPCVEQHEQPPPPPSQPNHQ